MSIAEPSVMISIRLDHPVVMAVDEIANEFNVSRAGLLRAVISRWTEVVSRPADAPGGAAMSHKPFIPDPLDALLDGPLSALDRRQKDLISRLIGSPTRKPRASETGSTTAGNEAEGA